MSVAVVPVDQTCFTATGITNGTADDGIVYVSTLSSIPVNLIVPAPKTIRLRNGSVKGVSAGVTVFDP